MEKVGPIASIPVHEGFLAIWSTVGAEDETDYLHWLTREHIAERLGIDGFEASRVYRAIGVERRYFIRYQLASSAVVGSAAYLARLNAPTPWSQRIMPKLGAFVRGGGRVIAQSGEGRGGSCAAIAIDPRELTNPAQLVAGLAQADRITAASILLTDAGQTAIKTNEKGIRSGDGSFEAMLLIEGLDEASVRRTATAAGFKADGAMHQLIFAA